jgi:hypothetical protein
MHLVMDNEEKEEKAEKRTKKVKAEKVASGEATPEVTTASDNEAIAESASTKKGLQENDPKHL